MKIEELEELLTGEIAIKFQFVSFLLNSRMEAGLHLEHLIYKWVGVLDFISHCIVSRRVIFTILLGCDAGVDLKDPILQCVLLIGLIDGYCHR